MAFFYRGAGPGTYWRVNDPAHIGFIPHRPGQAPSPGRLMHHIARCSTDSPYISFSRSFAVARAYALVGSAAFASASSPGLVHEIEINDDSVVKVLDPIQEIAAALPPIWMEPSYQHDGDQSFLLGVIDQRNMHCALKQQCVFTPGSKATPRTPNLSIHLEALVKALRDAEVLIQGNVPISCFRQTYKIID